MTDERSRPVGDQAAPKSTPAGRSIEPPEQGVLIEAVDRFADVVGAALSGPYDATDALSRPCPNCEAAVGEKCTVVTELRGRRVRHAPCLARLRPPAEGGA